VFEKCGLCLKRWSVFEKGGLCCIVFYCTVYCLLRGLHFDSFFYKLDHICLFQTLKDILKISADSIFTGKLSSMAICSVSHLLIVLKTIA